MAQNRTAGGAGKTAVSSYPAALRKIRPALGLAGLFSAAVGLLMLTGSIYMLQVYDRVLGSGSVPTLLGLFGLVVVLYGFLGLYDFLRARVLGRAAMRLDQSLGETVFARTLDVRRQGASSGLRDLEMVRGFLSGPAMTGILDVPWVPFYLAILFVVHPWLGWLTLAGAMVVAVLAGLAQLFTRAPIRAASGHDAAEREFTEGARRGAEALHAMGMVGAVAQVWQTHHRTTLGAHQHAAGPSEKISAASRAFRMLLQSAILTMGAYLVLQQEISAGMIVASSILSGRALAPVDQVIGQWRTIGHAMAAHRRLSEEFACAAPRAQSVALPAPRGAITVKGLTKFAPLPSGVRASADRARMLTQVAFSLDPGDALGVIGHSASGKSSLARILAGVWAPDAGEIRFDGATPDQWPREELGRAIGYLPQEVVMVPGSIAENIARFEPDRKSEAVMEAAKLAGVHEMILALAQGYETMVGGAATPLSGGQIQRLGLARALYGNPNIVVLDEPNSNLDAAGDEALAQAIRALRARKATVIVMAHRPSAIAAVNKVMVLKSGTVAQFGPKEEVLSGGKAGARNASAAPASRAAPLGKTGPVSPQTRPNAAPSGPAHPALTARAAKPAVGKSAQMQAASAASAQGAAQGPAQGKAPAPTPQSAPHEPPSRPFAPAGVSAPAGTAMPSFVPKSPAATLSRSATGRIDTGGIDTGWAEEMASINARARTSPAQETPCKPQMFRSSRPN
ncbi:type I secretion system permease/ATPase [Litorivita sp. NS0012-18]|uniref:type I secretion system permease/ATPase n=1 Tax=Litorivita sp. NS0012-18 TaxID=3127655 RepID=UPI0031046386